MRPNGIVNWFVQLFAELGLVGCSSHSVRRTFVTIAARNAHRADRGLRDVQPLAGHRSIETRQRYIDGDTRGQRKLVSLL
jgi:integrase